MTLLDTMSMYIPRSHWVFEGLAKREKRRTLTNVVLPVPPSPTANAREKDNKKNVEAPGREMGARRMQRCTRSEQMSGAMTPSDVELVGATVSDAYRGRA